MTIDIPLQSPSFHSTPVTYSTGTSGQKGEPAGKAHRAQRRREIALLVAQQGRITVGELRERFGVSGVTARGDLDALEGAGDLVRSHGGAVSKVIVSRPSSLREVSDAQTWDEKTRDEQNANEQIRIAEAAVRLIRPADTAILCAGEATAAIASLMRNDHTKRATVITNSLPIASSLSDAPQISLVILGGLHRHPSGSFVGPHAEQMMESLHANHCFLNCPGFSPEAGITTPDIMEAHLNRRMLEAASEVTLLAELKSFGQRSLALIAHVDKISRIICDRTAPANELAALRNRKVEVVLV